MSLDDYNYYKDPRTHASKWYLEFDQASMTATVLLYNEEMDQEEQVEVPVSFQVCNLCDGKGTYVNPSIDSGGLSREDFEDDDDFYHDYRGGLHDVTCSMCGGERVVPVLSPDADPEISKQINNKIADDAAYARECAMELAMGC